ncbi:hypothetical protein I7I48_00890 [Histoplasma ohiense]|nr:hypothetical protein I7I48_00890 [Histoplasma ohiense (nom. inval.)]
MQSKEETEAKKPRRSHQNNNTRNIAYTKSGNRKHRGHTRQECKLEILFIASSTMLLSTKLETRILSFDSSKTMSAPEILETSSMA